LRYFSDVTPHVNSTLELFLLVIFVNLVGMFFFVLVTDEMNSQLLSVTVEQYPTDVDADIAVNVTTLPVFIKYEHVSNSQMRMSGCISSQFQAVGRA